MGLVLFTLPVLGAVTLGESIAVLGTIASFLLNHPHQQQPTFKAMTSCWGDPWPITFNYFRCAGKIIQAGPVQKHSQKKSKKGGPTYSQTVCVGFCEGERSIGRIWADGTVIYDPRPITAPPAWQANTPYAAGDVILPTAGGSWQFTASITADSGPTEPSWNFVADTATNDGSQVWIATPYVPRTFIGKSYNFNLRIYTGDEAQLPDSALEALVGVGNQSAYRGLVNIVLEDFDLSKYGNRIPNIEAEILPPPLVPYQFSNDPNWVAGSARTSMGDPDGRYGYFWGNEAVSGGDIGIVKVDLQTGSVVLDGPLIDGTTNDPDQALGPPMPSWTGDKVWYWSRNGSARQVMGHDKNTLILTDTFPLGVLTSMLSQTSVNGDGTMAAMTRYPGSHVQECVLVNLTSGTFSVTDLSTVGGPATSLVSAIWTSTFDNNGKLWFYDDHGNFWHFDVAQVGAGAPTILNGTSINARPDDGALYGPLSFNPDNDVMTAWSSNGNLYAVEIDTLTDTPGTIITIDSVYSNQVFGNGDLNGWHRSRYASLVNSSTFDNYVSIVDLQAGTQTDYPWSYWSTSGSPGPWQPGFWQSLCCMVSLDGSAVTAINADQISPINAPDTTYNDCLFFPISASGLLNLAQICADISDRVGLSGKYDFSELATVFPRGTAVLNRQKAREYLEAIMPAYFYDLTDIGPQVIGTLRKNSTLLVSIPENDLGADSDPSAFKDRISSNRGADLEIPRDLAVSYYDYNHDYQAGSQPDRRSHITQYSSGSNSITVPVVMTPGEAADMASRVLYQTWIERTPRKASVPLDYVYITPADLIEFTRDGELYRVRVTKARFNPSQVIDIEGVSEDTGVYNLTAGNPLADIATGAFSSQTIRPIVTPVLAVMDTAPLRGSDVQEIGTYVAGAPSIYDGGFDGESVQVSLDNSVYNQEGVILIQSTMGTMDTVLGDCPRFTVFDRTNSVDVTLLSGALASASEADMINLLTNLMWSSTGEIFQPKTCTPLGNNQYRLTDFLRGRYGTESFTGSHAMGEQFVFIDTSNGADIAYTASRIGQAVYWKAVNDAATAPESTPQLLTMTTRRLMPWAPYFMRGARDGSNNLTITGLRRMRWRGRPLWSPPETDLPIAMEIDIYNGLTVVRTLTATLTGSGSGITDAAAFTAYYSAADQTTDFGSPQASLSIIAYQLNSVVGRGYGGGETV